MIIWVVDSSDRDRMSECCDELWILLGDKELEGCCLLVLANKQDLRNAMSVEEIAEQLKLNSLQDRAWRKFISLTCEYVRMSLLPMVCCHPQISRGPLLQTVMDYMRGLPGYNSRLLASK